MGHVEQPGLGAGVQMLLEDAGRILHGHFIAGERHHLAAEFPVQIVERGALRRFAGTIAQRPSLQQNRLLRRPTVRTRNPALSWDLRASRHRSEEHTSELQSLMRTSYAVFCLK